jgi:hypothetical protein
MGSGKSTVAQLLQRRGYERHSWADGVRDIFSMAYEAITPANYAEVKATNYKVFEHGTAKYRTGRDLLQRIGTDAMRDNVDETFWLKAGLRRIGDVPTVNDDTRFINEAAALRDLGFTIIRITRPGVDREDLHPSETEQTSIVADFELWNNGTIDDLDYALGNILASGDSPAVGRVTRVESSVVPEEDIEALIFAGGIFAVGHEVVSEEWGTGDGDIYTLLGDVKAVANYRGVWPPDTRVAGLLTCCGQPEHPIDCPQWR